MSSAARECAPQVQFSARGERVRIEQSWIAALCLATGARRWRRPRSPAAIVIPDPDVAPPLEYEADPSASSIVPLPAVGEPLASAARVEELEARISELEAALSDQTAAVSRRPPADDDSEDDGRLGRERLHGRRAPTRSSRFTSAAACSSTPSR